MNLDKPDSIAKTTRSPNLIKKDLNKLEGMLVRARKKLEEATSNSLRDELARKIVNLKKDILVLREELMGEWEPKGKDWKNV